MNSNHLNPPRIILSKLVCGLLLIAAGGIYSLDRLGYLDARHLLDYWPVILIAVGLAKIVQPRAGKGRFGGLILVLVGGVILGENLRLFDVELADIVPLVLVLIGLRIVWHSRAPSSVAMAQPGTTDVTNSLRATAILGGSARSNTSQDFRGGNLTAILGGHEIDLRGAKISHGPAVLDIFTVWGGIEIRVPEDWKVQLEGTPLLGSFEDNTRTAIEIEHGRPSPSDGSNAAKAEGVRLDKGGSDPLATEARPQQVLIVQGMAIMGGVEIKN